jgi:hypothetical protein
MSSIYIISAIEFAGNISNLLANVIPKIISYTQKEINVLWQEIVAPIFLQIFNGCSKYIM